MNLANLADSLSLTLARLQEDCPQVRGAVLANGEGLILAARGQLAGDSAAASAVHLTEEVERCLRLLSGEGCESMLIWGQSSLWCLVRLPGRLALMVLAAPDCRAGALKLGASRAAHDLLAALVAVDAPADVPGANGAACAQELTSA